MCEGPNYVHLTEQIFVGRKGRIFSFIDENFKNCRT